MSLVPYNEKNEIVKAKKKLNINIKLDKAKTLTTLKVIYEILKVVIILALAVFICRFPKILLLPLTPIKIFFWPVIIASVVIIVLFYITMVITYNISQL